MDLHQQYPYLSYVHTTQGSASTSRYSNGNTLPLTQMPWGMNAFTLQTKPEGNWFYSPYDRSLEGVRLTHLPSPWVGDFGSLLILPQRELSSSTIWSGYRPDEAILDPQYLKVNFIRHNITFELTPTERGACIRLTCAKAKYWYLSLFVTDHSISARYIKEKNLVLGWTNSFSGIGSPKAGYKMYFALQFSGSVDSTHSQFNNEQALHIALSEESVTVKLATSFISEAQAILNIEQELSSYSFDELVNRAATKWNDLLGRISIKTHDQELLHTFYSCLYRTCLFPNKMYEIDDSGERVHYDSYNDCVRPGVLYTNNGFWDTYRTVYPLYSLFAQEELHEILQGFLQVYLDTGWLPKWHSLHETGIMPGTLIDAILADASVKGILTANEQELALEAMLKHANNVAPHPFGRPNINLYAQYGYLPRERVKESVNNTLDYTYGDFCIAQMAEKLGKAETAAEYERRSKNYRKLFDPISGFMRGVDSNGNMEEAFDSYSWGGDYTESSAWQNAFSVYYDLHGLAELHGGKENLIKSVEKVFTEPPYYHVGTYGFEIHEMTEMAAVDFGQCAISNQPSFHIPWLFAALGKPELSEYWRDRISKELFSWRVDGFPGDEDNGSMSAWYIFSVLGIYPLCPGKSEYVSIQSLVEDISICGRRLNPARPDRWIRHEDCLKGD